MNILGHLFMRIMEIRRKGGWKIIGCMWGGKWTKIMEIEENRGPINKKALEDHSEGFFSNILSDVLDFSLYILSPTLLET